MTRQDDTVPISAKEPVRRRFFWYVALVLFLAFAFLCASGYIIGYSTLFRGVIREEARFFLKDILFSVGTACIVSLLFGALLELPATADFVARKLSDLIFGDEYLRRIRPSLPAVRRHIDRVLFGEAELASQHSLYNFMENRLHDLYRSSFRRNFSAEYRCTLESENRLLWKRRTNYTYIRNHLDPNEAVIRSQSSLDIPPEWLPKSKADESAAFNRIVNRISLKVGSCEYECAEGDRSSLKCADAASAKMPSEIKIDFDFRHGKLNFRVKCNLPLEMLETELFIEILYENYTLREPGNLLYSCVVAPTEDFTLDCFFPEGTRLEPGRFFWRSIPQMADLRTESGAISVKIPGWLLQGEGGCVAWFLPTSALTSVGAHALIGLPSVTRTET